MTHRQMLIGFFILLPIVFMMCFLSCEKAYPDALKFVGKVWIEKLEQYVQFEKEEVIWKDDAFVFLRHRQDIFKTNWSIIDGIHPIKNVVFYKTEAKHEDTNSDTTDIGFYVPFSR
uniref:Uncharacterized protein n=1 Tax=viral metagenome TaxID=1070528 RepID=A0A6M3KQF2_9ZZZZ